MLTGAALRYRLCPPGVMLGQLDRLVTLSALPNVKLDLCKSAHRVPSAQQTQEVASGLPEASGLVAVDITERAAVVSGLAEEQPRYYLQHALGFQVHDVRRPHRDRRHGRADTGGKEREPDD